MITNYLIEKRDNEVQLYLGDSAEIERLMREIDVVYGGRFQQDSLAQELDAIEQFMREINSGQKTWDEMQLVARLAEARK